MTRLPCSEKNWAFRELDGELLILHKLAPVTTFLRIAPAAPKGLELVSATSYWTVPHRVQILSHAGLSFDEEVRRRRNRRSMHASDASPPCVALTAWKPLHVPKRRRHRWLSFSSVLPSV